MKKKFGFEIFCKKTIITAFFIVTAVLFSAASFWAYLTIFKTQDKVLFNQAIRSSYLLNYDESDTLFKESLRITKDRDLKTRILYNLGALRVKEILISQSFDNIDKGIYYFQETLKLDSGNMKAKYNLDFLLRIKASQRKMEDKDSVPGGKKPGQPNDSKEF